MKKITFFGVSLCVTLMSVGQNSITSKRFNLHFQQTVVSQNKPSVQAAYTGTNSVLTTPESDISLTSTLFAGFRLGKNTEFYFNPEIAGGAGISGVMGIAGSPNGETFRIGSTDPKLYTARAFLKQTFRLGTSSQTVTDVANQLAGEQPLEYFSIIAGKFCLADYFDKNSYSHDPRTQFMNWSLMSNGAWDYPANTRGYTVGLVMEFRKKQYALRYATAQLPTIANGPILDANIIQALGHVAEFDYTYKPGTIIRLLIFCNYTKMANYAEATPKKDLESVRRYGTNKYGLGLNWEKKLSENKGIFARISWNDGINETWAFTEIDHSASVGMVWKGKKHNDDIKGIALVANGISSQHRSYLAAGGLGFMLGDGKLTYSPECITECYYSYKVADYPVWITPDYQFIMNPGYNQDRGPVHIFNIRVHTEF